MAVHKVSTNSKFTMDPYVVNRLRGLAIDNARLKIKTAALAALTISTGGTPALVIAAAAVPAAVPGAATTSAPKAGFDTVLAIIANSIASLASRVNAMSALTGGDVVTDNSAGSVSTTLAAVTNALTAVDGSSGTVALDAVTAKDRMTKVNNAISALAAAINAQAAAIGYTKYSDASAGVVALTIPAIAATGTGVGGTGNVTMLNSAVNTWLTTTRNNISSLGTLLNAVTNNTNLDLPLSVVAV